MDQYEGSLGEGRAIIAWKPIAWFLGIAFSGAWILFLLPLAIGPAGSPAYRVAVLVTFPVAMWMPGIAAILATVVIGGQRFGSLNLRRLGPKRFYLWAWLLPPVLALATGLLTVVLGAGQLDLSFGLIREALMTAPALKIFLYFSLSRFRLDSRSRSRRSSIRSSRLARSWAGGDFYSTDFCRWGAGALFWPAASSGDCGMRRRSSRASTTRAGRFSALG